MFAIVRMTFLISVLLIFNEIEAFFGFEALFGNSMVKDYRVYWNVPTFMCHQHGMYFEEVSRNFGITQNNNDDFRGNEIAILYDPGMFPALLKSPNGSLLKRNGGVPQEGNLMVHLELFKSHITERIPDKQFNGLGVIDFESWRPIFRQNWASLAPYRDYSIKIIIQKHPNWDKKTQEREAIREFEKWGRVFMEETLKTAKTMRPHATWGYYAYPYCFNLTPNQRNFQCDRKVLEENNKMSWLFSTEDVLLPSVYLRSNLTESQKIGLINGRITEAVRISKKVRPRNKVFAYFWYKYQDQSDIFLSQEDTVQGMREIIDRGADGHVIWGSSNDLNSKEKCQIFRDYLNDVLGPAIVESREIANQRLNVDQEETNGTQFRPDYLNLSSEIDGNFSTFDETNSESPPQPSAISVP